MKKNLAVALLTYNRSGYLRQSLEALLGQTYGDFELMVCDNHSTDDTAELVLACKDPRITYVRHAPGGNPGSNHLSAIRMTRGDFILITHDDDIAEPRLLERQMAFMERHPDTRCLAANVSLIDGEGRLLQPRLYDMDQDRLFPPGEYIRCFLEEKLWLPAPTYLHQRKVLEADLTSALQARYIPYLPSGDIWHTFQANLRGPIALLAEPLLRYRQHAGQETRTVPQSAPLVHLIEELLKRQRNTPELNPMLPAIHAALAKFKVQDLLFGQGHTSLHPEVLSALRAMRQQWVKSTKPEDRCRDAILPFEILLGLAGLEATLPPEAPSLFMTSPPRDGAQEGYRNWLALAREGRSLFQGPPQLRRVVILGSMLAAFLIVLEAQRAGIQVACCIDSSPQRIGEKLLGVPVRPFEALGELPEPPDAVILSSERDHETAIRSLLTPFLPSPGLPVISWKELARGRDLHRQVSAS